MQTAEANRINYSSKAVRQLKKFNKDEQVLVKNKIKELENPSNSWSKVKSLVNHDCQYRLKIKVGSKQFRVLFDFDSSVRIVEIQEIKKRDDNTY